LAPQTKRDYTPGKTDSINSSFINEYYARPRSNFDAWSNHSYDSQTELVPPKNPFASPAPSIFSLDDSSRPGSRGGDDYSMHTIEKFSVYPSDDLLIYPNDVEPDDYMHTPDPNEKGIKRDCNIWSRRGLVNLGGLGLLAGGMIFLFIVLPAV